MNYPPVFGEFATIERILTSGCSIARFGDGEVKLMSGGSQIREPANAVLAAELRDTIVDPDPRCIVGIPTMDPKGPKFKNWEARAERTKSFLSPDVTYFSAFISRPDSSPWILTRKYADMVTEIWRGRKVGLICEEDNKIYTVLRKTGAASLRHLPCPHTETSAKLGELEAACLKGRFDVVVMSCGPAATVLARRLSKQGMQAIDIGSAGGFLLKLLDLEPMQNVRTVLLERPPEMTDAQMRAKLEADWTVRYFEEKE